MPCGTRKDRVDYAGDQDNQALRESKALRYRGKQVRHIEWGRGSRSRW